MRQSDFNFIMHTWLHSYKESGATVRYMPEKEYFETYRPMLMNKLNNAVTHVACLKDDQDVILGYLTYEYNEVVHYIFVKDSWRRLGIMKMLLKSIDLLDTVYFTHWTRPVNALILSFPKWIYNPFKWSNHGRLQDD
jgi:GNAT superfamily N-acetyltransferase